MNVQSLLQQFRQPGTRPGIGIWLLPPTDVGQEAVFATRLELQAVDARQVYLQSLPQGARFSGLTRPNGHYKLVEIVRQLAGSIHQRPILLLHTLDLLLLGLEVDERERFWKAVLELPYPRTKLVLTIPEGASELLSFELKRCYAAYIAEGSIK